MPAPTPAEALDAWARACEARAARPPETVRLNDALGRVTHAPVRALRSSPAFPAAAMDGIAVRAADVSGAGPETPVELDPSRYTPVDTGDPLPPDRDAVVMRERVEYTGDVARVTAAAGRGKHVRARSARTSPPASCSWRRAACSARSTSRWQLPAGTTSWPCARGPP